jgi:hypothetical protein
LRLNKKNAMEVHATTARMIVSILAFPCIGWIFLAELAGAYVTAKGPEALTLIVKFEISYVCKINSEPEPYYRRGTQETT